MKINTFAFQFLADRLKLKNHPKDKHKTKTKMTVQSKLLFILIGDDKTGKTNLQKYLIKELCNQSYDKLPVNVSFNITHPEIKKKFRNISFGNRSYQEKRSDYGSVDNYFEQHFKAADICIVSSHLVESDIEQMILNGKKQYYNVIGVFFSNSIKSNSTLNSQISLLNWNERLYIENPTIENHEEDLIKAQLKSIASNFVYSLINRTNAL